MKQSKKKNSKAVSYEVRHCENCHKTSKELENMMVMLKFHETKNYFLGEINALFEEAFDRIKIDPEIQQHYDVRLSNIQEKMRETLAIYLEEEEE